MKRFIAAFLTFALTLTLRDFFVSLQKFQHFIPQKH